MTRLRLNGHFGFAHFEPNLQWSLKHVKFDDMPARINSNVVVPFPIFAWMFHLKSHIFLSLLAISCDLNSLVFEFENRTHQLPVPVERFHVALGEVIVHGIVQLPSPLTRQACSVLRDRQLVPVAALQRRLLRICPCHEVSLTAKASRPLLVYPPH